MEKKFISIVVYLYNDEKRVETFLENLLPTVKNYFSQYEIVCIDNGCTDNTIEIVKNYISKHGLSEMVSIVRMGFHQGLEAAMNAGRDVSIGDFVYEFDSVYVDYNPQVITDIFEKMLEGYDIVAASNNEKMRLSSKLFYKLFNKHSSSMSKLGTESFRIISRRAINRVQSVGSYIPYRKAVYANCGLKMLSYKYDSVLPLNEKRSKNDLDTAERSVLAADSFLYFTNITEKISGIISVGFLVFSLLMLIYTIADYCIEGHLAEGWTSIMCFVSFGFFGVFLLLTIVLKYLSVLLNLIFRKQKYLIADVEKIAGK